jgi:hypothetical protein
MYYLFRVWNKGSTVIFCYLFSSALLISLNFPFICVLFFFWPFRVTFYFTNPDCNLIRMTSLPKYSELARVYGTFTIKVCTYRDHSLLRVLQKIFSEVEGPHNVLEVNWKAIVETPHVIIHTIIQCCLSSRWWFVLYLIYVPQLEADIGVRR